MVSRSIASNGPRTFTPSLVSASLIPRRGAEQPALELGRIYAVMDARGGEAPAQLTVIVLQAEDQNPGTLEDVLACQRSTGRQRDVLQGSQRGLAGGARRQHTGQEPPAELIAEQPFPRRRNVGVIARIPIA
jgi:hypothetical protein